MVNQGFHKRRDFLSLFVIMGMLFSDTVCLAQQTEEKTPSVSLSQVRHANRRYAHEPGVDQILAAAIRYARLSGKRIDDAASRARHAGWVPTLRTGVSRGIGRDLSEQQSLSSDRVNLSTDDDLRLEAALVFDFSKLVFSNYEVPLLGQERIRNEERQSLTQTIVHAYYERRRLQLERDLFGKQALNKLLRIAELGAFLDAISGGEFYRHFKKGHHSNPR